VESVVQACPQVVHRNALAPLENRDRIVDMTRVAELLGEDRHVTERLRF
jgi:hypothetical protein